MGCLLRGKKKGAVRGTTPTPFTVFRPWPVAAHEEKKSLLITLANIAPANLNLSLKCI
jgi:hypothetical protein